MTINEQSHADLSRRLEALEKAFNALASQSLTFFQQAGNAVNAILHSQAVYLGNHRALTFLYSGQKIFVDTRSVDIGTHLLLNGLWEQNYVKAFLNLLRPGNVVLDIGANHGVYALVAAQHVGAAGRVLAFEPNPAFAELIRASVSVNGLSDVVTVVQAAVSDSVGEVVLIVNPMWSGGAHLQQSADEPDGSNTHRVSCLALDDYSGLAGASVDAIKMDIEGAEGLALQGMRQLIDRSPRLKIMMEFCPSMLARYPVDAQGVVAFLDGRGFSCWQIAADGSVRPDRWTTLLSEPDRVRNVIASRYALT